MMQVKCRQIKKQLEEKGALNPAQQLTYDMATKGASAVCPENLQPVIDWSNSVKYSYFPLMVPSIRGVNPFPELSWAYSPRQIERK